MINIYYRYSKLDKQHQYSVVCKQLHGSDYVNYWIFWVWFKMGNHFGKMERCKFSIYPFELPGSKLIKKYKSCNSGTDRIVPAILSHFNKCKK